MIEKIKNKTGTRCGQILPVSQDTIINKINELVDAVNNQQTQLNDHGCRLLDLQNRITVLDDPSYREAESELADPYVEQRKWIGKLCMFWDDDYEHDYFDTLKGITDDGLFIGHNGTWKHCEPVKLDDEIIYKGE